MFVTLLYILLFSTILCAGCVVNSSQGNLRTGNIYDLDDPGIESRWGGGEIFRTLPGRPCGPPGLLYNGYLVFPGCKAARGRGVDHPPPSNSEVKERVDVYLLSISGFSQSVVGCTQR